MIRRVEVDLLRNMRAFLKRSPYKFAVGGTLTAFAVYNIPKSDCAPKDKENKDDSISSFIGGILGPSDNSNNGGKKPDPIGELLNQYMPQIQQLGFGGIMGVCTGVALKRLGNETAAVVGFGFAILQALSYTGYIKIDYGKVQEDATKLIDADGDNKITTNDAVVLWEKFKDIMSFNLPGASGFSAGVALGMYFGR